MKFTLKVLHTTNLFTFEALNGHLGAVFLNTALHFLAMMLAKGLYRFFAGSYTYTLPVFMFSI